MANKRGMSYKKRVADINRIYDEHARNGLSNREIWRRYIYPVYVCDALSVGHAALVCHCLLHDF